MPSEQELAEYFGISRPSVREALTALEVLGITERSAGRGNFIKSINQLSNFNEIEFHELAEEESPFDLLEARKYIEANVAELASIKRTEEDLISIGKTIKNMKNAFKDIPRMMEIDREFHICIAKASHNNLFLSIMLNISELLKEKLWTRMKEKSWNFPGYREKYFKEHTAIFEAIKNQDAKSARKATYIHLDGVEKDFLK